MKFRAKILIVEDDEAIATGLVLNLRLAGHEPVSVCDGEEAHKAIQTDPPNLILLDINLPKQDGLSVLGELRRSGNQIPVIVLSAREGEYDKVAALRLGADDYVTKPFALAELLARVDAVLRRTQTVPPTPANGSVVSSFGDITVNLQTRRVTRKGSEIKLTHLEFELLAFFLSHPDHVFTREELLKAVWQTRNGSPRTVDNFLGQLRAKLESDPEQPRNFVTVRGSGYRFDP